jgi:hypothetical protein
MHAVIDVLVNCNSIGGIVIDVPVQLYFVPPACSSTTLSCPCERQGSSHRLLHCRRSYRTGAGRQRWGRTGRVGWPSRTPGMGALGWSAVQSTVDTEEGQSQRLRPREAAPVSL